MPPLFVPVEPAITMHSHATPPYPIENIQKEHKTQLVKVARWRKNFLYAGSGQGADAGGPVMQVPGAQAVLAIPFSLFTVYWSRNLN